VTSAAAAGVAKAAARPIEARAAEILMTTIFLPVF
jgi:hypothetical protein